MFLVPQHQIELMRSNPTPRQTLRETVQNDLDEKMRTILADNNDNVYNKAKRYSAVLQRFLALVRQETADNVATNPPSEADVLSSPTIKEKPEDNVQTEILNNIAKNSRTKAQYILEKMSGARHIASWNNQGEFVFNNRTIPGTHLYDLIKNVTYVQNIPDKRRPKGWTEYLQALAEINIPLSLISNPEVRDLVEGYKAGRTDTVNQHTLQEKTRKTRAHKPRKVWNQTDWVTF